MAALRRMRERANENRASIASIEDAHRALRGLLHNTSNLSPLCSLMREKLFALVAPPPLYCPASAKTIPWHKADCQALCTLACTYTMLSMGAKLIPNARHHQRYNSVINTEGHSRLKQVLSPQGLSLSN